MNKKILLSCIFLNIIGLIMIYSSSSIWAKYKFNDQFRYLKFQAIFMIVGLILIKIISKINLDYIKKKSNLLLITGLILLILIDFVGHPV